MSTAQSTLLSAVLVIGGIAVYHFALAPRPGGATTSPSPAEAGSLEGQLAALRRDVDALRREGGGPGVPGDASRALAALSSRIEALEGRLIPSSAEAGANQGHLPPGVGSKSFTEEQITSLRAMLDEVDARRNADRETASYRDLVKRVAPTLSAADESATVSLLTAFMRTVRTLFVGGSAGNTDDERAATNARAAAERAKLFQNLAAFLPADVVERLSPHIPDFASPPGHTPPNKEAPK